MQKTLLILRPGVFISKMDEKNNLKEGAAPPSFLQIFKNMSYRLRSPSPRPPSLLGNQQKGDVQQNILRERAGEKMAVLRRESAYTQTTWTTIGRCITHQQHSVSTGNITEYNKVKWTKHESSEVFMLPIGNGNMAKRDFHFACLTLKMWIFPPVISDYRETFDTAGLNQWRLRSVLHPPSRTLVHLSAVVQPAWQLRGVLLFLSLSAFG